MIAAVNGVRYEGVDICDGDVLPMAFYFNKNMGDMEDMEGVFCYPKCDEGLICCGGRCCSEGEVCGSDNKSCCPSDRPFVCGGGCYPEGGVCCNNSYCDGRCCNGVCCEGVKVML